MSQSVCLSNVLLKYFMTLKSKCLWGVRLLPRVLVHRISTTFIVVTFRSHIHIHVWPIYFASFAVRPETKISMHSWKASRSALWRHERVRCRHKSPSTNKVAAAWRVKRGQMTTRHRSTLSGSMNSVSAGWAIHFCSKLLDTTSSTFWSYTFVNIL